MRISDWSSDVCSSDLVGLAVVQLLETGEMQERAKRLGERLGAGLRAFEGKGVTAVRCQGLWAGIDIDPEMATAREVCTNLLERGILAKDTHGQTVRLAPLIVITEEESEWAIAPFGEALAGFL